MTGSGDSAGDGGAATQPDTRQLGGYIRQIGLRLYHGPAAPLTLPLLQSQVQFSWNDWVLGTANV